MASPDAVSIARELGVCEPGAPGSLALLGPGDHAAPYPSCRAKACNHEANRVAYFSSLCRLFRPRNSRHTVGTMLADMGEHQLTIRDYLRHSNLHVTNKYLQATPESKRLAQGKLVDAILPGGLLSASKSTLIQ